MDTTALILVDIQNDYFPGGKMTLEGVEPACANAARLLQHFRDKRLPVFHVRHLAVQPGATFFLPETPGVEIHPSVAPMPGETVVVKHFPNSFRETTLLDQLKKALILTIVATALAISVCSTALRAADLPRAEQKQIEALIAAIERMTDAAFIRNDRPYGSAAAAEFLRRKWRHREEDIRTADDFIEKVASFSSTTGRPYLIRFRDGRETPCSIFLRTELSSLRKNTL